MTSTRQSRMKSLKILGLAMTLMLVFLFLITASKSPPPQPPMFIFGYVFIDGAPAPAGLNVSARIGGGVIDSNLTDATGHYAPLEIPGSYDGQVVSLYVQEWFIQNETIDIFETPLLYKNLTLAAEIKFNETTLVFHNAWVVYGLSTPYGPLIYSVIVDDIVAGTDFAGILAGTGHFDNEAGTTQWTGTEWNFTWKPAPPVPVVSVGGMGANLISWAYRDAAQPFNVTVIPGAELRLYVATDKYIMYDITNNIYYYVNSTGTYDVRDVFGLNNNQRPHVDFGLIYTHRDLANGHDLFIVQGLAAKGNVAAGRWFTQNINNLPPEVAELTVVVLAWDDLNGDSIPTHDETFPITVFP